MSKFSDQYCDPNHPAWSQPSPPKDPKINLDRDVQKAVDEVLNTNEWPIYKLEDDRGLEQSEYYEFALAVVRQIRANNAVR